MQNSTGILSVTRRIGVHCFINHSSFYTYNLPWGHIYMKVGSLQPISLSLAMISSLYHTKQFQVVLNLRWFTLTWRPLGSHLQIPAHSKLSQLHLSRKFIFNICATFYCFKCWMWFTQLFSLNISEKNVTTSTHKWICFTFYFYKCLIWIGYLVFE